MALFPFIHLQVGGGSLSELVSSQDKQNFSETHKVHGVTHYLHLLSVSSK